MLLDLLILKALAGAINPMLLSDLKCDIGGEMTPIALATIDMESRWLVTVEADGWSITTEGRQHLAREVKEHGPQHSELG
jgi:hypothetical protein